jgi:hypothetical protein
MVVGGRRIPILSGSIVLTVTLYYTRKIPLFIKSRTTLMRCLVQLIFISPCRAWHIIAFFALASSSMQRNVRWN